MEIYRGRFLFELRKEWRGRDISKPKRKEMTKNINEINNHFLRVHAKEIETFLNLWQLKLATMTFKELHFALFKIICLHTQQMIQKIKIRLKAPFVILASALATQIASNPTLASCNPNSSFNLILFFFNNLKFIGSIYEFLGFIYFILYYYKCSDKIEIQLNAKVWTINILFTKNCYMSCNKAISFSFQNSTIMQFHSYTRRISGWISLKANLSIDICNSQLTFIKPKGLKGWKTINGNYMKYGNHQPNCWRWESHNTNRRSKYQAD